MNIIALVFDFDDTLVPDSTTQLLKRYGINTKKFWGEDFVVLVKQGYNPVNAYLKLMLEEIRNGKLKSLKNKNLREFGKNYVSKTLYPGIHGLLTDLKHMVGYYDDIDIEFYIISSGLEEIIRGAHFLAIVLKKFMGVVWAGILVKMS